MCCYLARQSLFTADVAPPLVQQRHRLHISPALSPRRHGGQFAHPASSPPHGLARPPPPRQKSAAPRALSLTLPPSLPSTTPSHLCLGRSPRRPRGHLRLSLALDPTFLGPDLHSPVLVRLVSLSSSSYGGRPCRQRLLAVGLPPTPVLGAGPSPPPHALRNHGATVPSAGQRGSPPALLEGENTKRRARATRG